MPTAPEYSGVQTAYGHLRASHADRERAIDVLKAAFAEGRLEQDEYTERVGQVYRSRTYADLAALTWDLPVGPLGSLLPQAPALPEPYQPRWPAQRTARVHPPVVVGVLLAALVAAAADPLILGPFGILALIAVAILILRLVVR
jgi:Domain of unknown function (DUF1707)